VLAIANLAKYVIALSRSGEAVNFHHETSNKLSGGA